MARTLLSDSLEIDDMVERLCAIYESTDQQTRDAGEQWYPSTLEYARQLAQESGVDLRTVVAVIAAYSPQVRWADNRDDARNLLLGGPKRPGRMQTNHARALRVLHSPDPIEELLKGSKTRRRSGLKMYNFAHNILGSAEHVTIDIWATRAATGLKFRIEEETDQAQRLISWAGAYEKIADAYRKAAANLGVEPPHLQATVWIAVRGRAN